MTLREAWTRVVTPADYDRHMAEVGQAEANALLIGELFGAAAPGPGTRVLIAGAGTGQMFDYLPDAVFAPYRVVCTDVNPEFLKTLGARRACETVIDDVEDSHLEPGFGAAILCLVLEHVHWRKALSSVARLRPERLIVVIQRNPEGMESAVTPGREPAGSLRVFVRDAPPHLIEPGELLGELERLGFRLLLQRERAVQDGKAMSGFLLASGV